jgi:hypothetical protein
MDFWIVFLVFNAYSMWLFVVDYHTLHIELTIGYCWYYQCCYYYQQYLYCYYALALAFPKKFERLFCDLVTVKSRIRKNYIQLLWKSYIRETRLHNFNIFEQLKILSCLFYHIRININSIDLSSWDFFGSLFC